MIDLFAEPSSYNLAWQWVNYILPSDTSTAWGQALSVFSSILVFFASSLLAYKVVTGIVQSAYTGKVLGEQWHQIWVPLRVIFAFGLLVPFSDGGFSGIHYTIKHAVAKPAVNVGDAIWVSFVDSVAGKSVPILPATSGGSSVVLSVLEHEICAAIYNELGNLWGWSAQVPEPKGSVSGDRVTWSYGSTCGNISYTMVEDRPSFSEVRRSIVGATISNFRSVAQMYADAVAKNSGINSPGGYVNAISSGSLPPALVSDIRNAGQQFDRAIQQAAQNEALRLESESRAKLVDAARQQGWMASGSYWRGLSEISMLGNRLSGEKPERTAPRIDDDFGLAIQRGFEALRYQISGEASEVQLSANDFAAVADDRADFLTKLLGPLARDIGVWLTSTEKDTQVDAMGRMIASGQTMVTAAETTIVLGGAVMVGSSNFFAEKLGAGGAASWFLDWAKFIIGALWLVGALWAYVIPMLPTIFVFIAGCLFVVSIMEALIASLLWCLTFMSFDNEDFIGSAQRMGLRLLINITLRPALAVLSLCAGFLFFPPALDALDALWPLAFFAQTGGYVPGLSALVVMLLVKAFLVWIICTRGFGMIAAMPDRIAAWLEIQGAGATMSEGDHTSGAVAGAVALASRGSPGAVPSGRDQRLKPSNDREKRKES